MKRGGELKRTELKRGSSRLERRTRLPRVGKKGQRDVDEMREARGALLARSGGHCEGRRFSPECTTVGRHAHHKRRRSQGGTNDPDNLVWLCYACHAAVHANPTRAAERGLIIRTVAP